MKLVVAFALIALGALVNNVAVGIICDILAGVLVMWFLFEKQ